jgi:hypothetical protein
MPQQPARKVSDLQDGIATFYEHLTRDVTENNGVFMGDNFTAGQRKSIARDLKGLATTWRERADRNRSIDN